MTDQETAMLMDVLKENYEMIRELPGRGFIGIRRMFVTWGLFYGLDMTGYRGRYCYQLPVDAVKDLLTWTGDGDPEGPWIKHKGEIEYNNPKDHHPYDRPNPLKSKIEDDKAKR